MAASERHGLPVPMSWVPTVGSTNAVLKRAVLQGVPHGTSLIAGQQLSGRGRLGRSWLPAEGNLYLSMVLRPALSLSATPMLCLAAAVCLAEVIGPEHCRIKWPNDVLDLNGRKVSGILAEAELRGGELDALVLGIGVNVASAPTDAPFATSLAQMVPQPPSLADLAGALVAGILRWTTSVEQGTTPLLDAWRAHQGTLGQRVRVREIEGVAKDIGADGALLIVSDDGVLHRVLAGDVQMVAGA